MDKVQEQALDWARDIGILGSEKFFQECVDCGYARCASLAYPNASLADLSLATRWIVFLFALDVHTDETPYDSLSSEHLAFLRNMGAIVSRKADSPIEPESLKSPFGEALLELWVTSRTQFKNPGWERRLSRCFHEYQSSILWEIALRKTGEVPDYLTFSAYKLRSCQAPIGVGLVELFSPTALPDAILDSLLMENVRLLVCDLINMATDLGSAQREQDFESVPNTFTSLQHTLGTTPDETVLHYTSIWRARMNTLLSIRDRIDQYYPSMCAHERHIPATRDYINEVILWLGGSMEFVHESRRYSPVSDIDLKS
ncbi:terpene synthase family protein [Streptomyces niveus]|uniref:terpene synthase family protein n=1 Tax=Streptomyces niveus TaxID=193462 RepID=UPI00365574D2